MNADGKRMKAEEVKATDAWVLAWSQVPRRRRLSPALRRLLAALLGEFKAIFWSWS